jgi:hypothetical protein
MRLVVDGAQVAPSTGRHHRPQRLATAVRRHAPYGAGWPRVHSSAFRSRQGRFHRLGWEPGFPDAPAGQTSIDASGQMRASQARRVGGSSGRTASQPDLPPVQLVTNELSGG